MNKVVKYGIIFGTLGVTGVVGYFLYKKYKEKKNKNAQGGTVLELPAGNIPLKDYKGDLDLIKASNNSSNSITPPPKSPFTSSESGNYFRAYVNDVYSSWARANDLDREGSYNNSYIRKAWDIYGKRYVDLLHKNKEVAIPNLFLRLSAGDGEKAANFVRANFWSNKNSALTEGVDWWNNIKYSK